MERFAAHLESRARSFLRGFAFVGALLGGLVGALPLTPLDSVFAVPSPFGFATLALGASAGGFVGFATARNRAGMLRLHAQSTLCQLHSQRTTFALWLLLKERTPELFGAAQLTAPVEPALELEPVSEPPLALPPAPAPATEAEVEVEPEPEPEPEAAFEPPAQPPATRPEPAYEPAHVFVTAPPPTTFVPVHAVTPAPAPPPLSPQRRAD